MKWEDILKAFPPIIHIDGNMYKLNGRKGNLGQYVTKEITEQGSPIFLTREKAEMLKPSEPLGELYGKPYIQLDDDEKGTSYQEFKNAAEGAIMSNTAGLETTPIYGKKKKKEDDENVE